MNEMKSMLSKRDERGEWLMLRRSFNAFYHFGKIVSDFVSYIKLPRLGMGTKFKVFY